MGDDGGVAEQRNNRSMRNLVGSLAVTCAVAGLLYLVLLPRGEGEDGAGAMEISYSQELGQARRVAPYAVSAPEGLPDGWRATSVTYDGEGSHGSTWHLGFVTPDDEYVAVEQGSEKPDRFISSVTQEARKADGARSVDGERWERYEGPKYDALVRREKGVTTVVTGTGTFDQLAEMAAALRGEKGEEAAGTQRG